jgi:hypothetical protein
MMNIISFVGVKGRTSDYKLIKAGWDFIIDRYRRNVKNEDPYYNNIIELF